MGNQAKTLSLKDQEKILTAINKLSRGQLPDQKMKKLG